MAEYQILLGDPFIERLRKVYCDLSPTKSADGASVEDIVLTLLRVYLGSKQFEHDKQEEKHEPVPPLSPLQQEVARFECATKALRVSQLPVLERKHLFKYAVEALIIRLQKLAEEHIA